MTNSPSPTPQRLTPADIRGYARIIKARCPHGKNPKGFCGDCDADERLLNAHAAYLETQEWQPIATAPKDGEWILLHYDPDHTPCIAFWGADSQNWLIAGGGSMAASKPKMWAALPKPLEPC